MYILKLIIAPFWATPKQGRLRPLGLRRTFHKAARICKSFMTLRLQFQSTPAEDGKKTNQGIQQKTSICWYCAHVGRAGPKYKYRTVWGMSPHLVANYICKIKTRGNRRVSPSHEPVTSALWRMECLCVCVLYEQTHCQLQIWKETVWYLHYTICTVQSCARD
jgi:hypothetical protein